MSLRSGLHTRWVVLLVAISASCLAEGCSFTLPDRLWDRTFLVVVRDDRYLLLSEDDPTDGVAVSEAEGRAWFEETLTSSPKWDERSKPLAGFSNEPKVGVGGRHMFFILQLKGPETASTIGHLQRKLEQAGHLVAVSDEEPLKLVQTSAPAP